ncbi:DUF885 domain-containing protein [Aeromicrobium sp. Leaf350]|uniref:DUF885 domain-containing protein n=1 Tax=Aeromicrobium sp. Leaf350 TaxID=2876565 RepID=UPI001E4E0061|nr:DUF885 domain-containing protein [Aeromicrobium sp. Leaf350]
MEREPTPLDRVAEDWLETLLELQPEWHVELGRPGREGEYADHSPDGHAALADAARSTLQTVAATDAVDEVDRVTRLELERTLGLAIEQFESGEWRRDLNVIASPAQGLREIFDLVPTETAEDWSHVARRLRNVPAAVDGYVASLTDGIDHDQTPAIRQVREVLEQVRELAGPESFFATLAGQGPDAQRDDLSAAAADAAAAYARLGEFLAHTLAPAAREQDAVGREAYALASRSFVGLEVDLDETYAWGVEELHRMVEEQEQVAREIVPGGSIADAIAALDADPTRTLHGTDALQAWMQETSDAALTALDGTHFDIAEPLHRLECRIAPTQNGGIYYTPPSEDFARAGRMWWSVPPGVTEFGTWRERTTVYHEGVPGHHLQCGVAVAAAATLNGWRRISWNSGHGEGWALYAERLMADLGFLDDPGDRLGMLDAQRQRAARVVVDIGVHLGLPKPDGSGPWRGDDVLPFMRQHMHMDEGFVQFESNRYLGWAGQAPSYKIGEREWTRLRDDWVRVNGSDLRRFHADALALGGVGLGTLRHTLLS